MLSGSAVVGFDPLEVVTTIVYSRTADSPFLAKCISFWGLSRAPSAPAGGSVDVGLGCVS
jgi:hypothetical protein